MYKCFSVFSLIEYQLHCVSSCLSCDLCDRIQCYINSSDWHRWVVVLFSNFYPGFVARQKKIWIYNTCNKSVIHGNERFANLQFLLIFLFILQLKSLLLHVLHFTSLLIEHSFSRHLYNSMEHLTTLLTSCDMTVVLAVLNLLYVFRCVHVYKFSPYSSVLLNIQFSPLLREVRG